MPDKSCVKRRRTDEGSLTADWKMHQIYDKTPDGIVLCDLEGRFLECNPAFAQMVGYTIEELRDLAFPDITPPQWHAMETDIIQGRLFAQGHSGLYVKEYIHRDGTVFPVELRAFLIRDRHNEPFEVWAFVRDISERTASEQKLSRLESRYRSITESTLSGIMVFEAVGQTGDFVVVEINQAAEDSEHLKRTEILGRRVREVYPQSLESGLFAALERVWRSSQAERFPLIRTREGRIEAWHDMYVCKLPSGEIMALSHDLSTQKQGEEQLWERQRELTTLMANLPGMAYRCRNDLDWTMEFVSEGCRGLTGYGAPELVGNARISYGALIHPEDREYVWDTIQAAIRCGERFQLVYRLITSSGKQRWVWEQGIGVDLPSGGGTVVEGFITDITQRRQMEEEIRRSELKFLKIFQSSPDAIAISTLKEGLYLDVNDAFLRYTGYTREEVIGRTSLEMGIWDSTREREESLARLVREGGLRDQERQWRTRTGQKLTILWSGELIEFGGEQCVLSVNHDITKRKQIETELVHSRSQLQIHADHLQTTLERERTEIAREIHDELGQILTALKMDLSWLRKRLPVSLGEPLGKLASMTDTVDHTITAVQRICAELRPAVLDDLGLEAAMQWQADRIQERSGLVCETIVDPALEGIELGHKITITVFRIFQEALINVVRHARASRVLSVLRIHDDLLELEVIDDGKGIAREALEDTSSFGVIGMQERANLVGGHTEIFAHQGGGTTVRVRLPLR